MREKNTNGWSIGTLLRAAGLMLAVVAFTGAIITSVVISWFSLRERILHLESRVSVVESNLHEIKSDVKALLARPQIVMACGEEDAE